MEAALGERAVGVTVAVAVGSYKRQAGRGHAGSS
jgi:hypothetical protein